MRRKSSSFFRKQASGSTNSKKKHPISPALDFAIRYNMLSDQEIEDCRNGKAYIRQSIIEYHWDHSNDRSKLYMGRRFQLLADQLLGLNDED